ncbi:TonB-dependent hemoglobin/transferrin/lactoferrin receptor family protein [Neorhizobium galegae bv. officinalis bv. officinalis str. HAMBI 1141]|uniref:TonB-dependent hemoglobin/transferrin/lactoferrin receptor family protein n=1 Tax=Neorhizobium galegae bv. officinalis bv. officinalis str. HAMBI 1141 TaxID=1028801 RepID=A0A068TA11_NEOGA|nr:TonB-dependent hemoglobin/transferrin/lactoferrin family receptor [Neorhizobium galegae]CDN54914.1 TonB-dependent hemoglobin/transferrin/lactoferrin receptor family protein [Neorhizobium galegae bv. officinalis bv. officinalis str. HAMBI 1141]
MLTRRLRSTLATCTALAVFSLACGASAQQAAQPQADTTLKPIVLKGKRVKAGDVAADTPLASTTTAEEIAKKDIGSIQDLGRSTEPGVDFSKNDGGLFIRGLGGARVTTLIDGIPIPFLSNDGRSGAGGAPTTATNAQGGGDSFDFSSLSTLDVLRGADSSRAGNGALGGALVLRTLEPEDLIGEGRDWSGIGKLTYDSQDNSFDSSVAVAKKIQNTSILFQGGYKKGHERKSNGDVGGIGPTRTEANPGDLDQNNLLFKLRQDLEGGHRVGLTAERFDRQFENDLKTSQGATTGSSRVYAPGDFWGHDDTRRERVSLDYQFEAPDPDSLINLANLTVYWQRLTKNAGNEGTRVGTVAGPWYRDNELQESTIGATGSLESQFETGGVSHTVTLGGNVEIFKARSFLDGVDACILGTASPIALAFSCPALHADQSDMPDVDGTRLGIYLDDKMEFGNGFALTPGVRFDLFEYRPKSSGAYTDNSGFTSFGLPDGTNGHGVSPKLLATYDVRPDVQLFAQWSMAYRAPTVSELYLNFANPAQGYAVIGNADLEPETANGFEIGANLGDENFGGRVRLFHNRYKNFIDSTSAPAPGFAAGITQNFNRSKVQISGIEVSGIKRFDNGFNVHGALAFAYGRDTETNEYIRTIAPLKAVVGVGYEQETWGVDLTGIFAGGMRHEGNPATFEAPSYGLADLTGWWEPEQTKGLRIQAGIYNLFDKTYYNAVALRDTNMSVAPAAGNAYQPAPYFSEPGRSFKLSLTQRF